MQEFQEKLKDIFSNTYDVCLQRVEQNSFQLSVYYILILKLMHVDRFKRFYLNSIKTLMVLKQNNLILNDYRHAKASLHL